MKICSNLEFKRLYGTRFALKVICSARFVSTFARTKDCLLLRLSCPQRSPVFCNMTNFSFLTDLMQSGPIAAGFFCAQPVVTGIGCVVRICMVIM